MKEMLAQVKNTPMPSSDNSVSKGTSKDNTAQIRKNFEDSLLLLSQELLTKAQEKKIVIQDTKDIKNIISVAQVLFSEGNSEADTPQVSIQLGNFYKDRMKVPEDAEVQPTDITRQVSEMSAEEVSKMIQDQAKAQNDANVETI